MKYKNIHEIAQRLIKGNDSIYEVVNSAIQKWMYSPLSSNVLMEMENEILLTLQDKINNCEVTYINGVVEIKITKGNQNVTYNTR